MIVKKELVKNRFLFYFLLCFFAMSLCIQVPAFAADEEDDEEEFTLEEITVTAEKREAELQKVPIDISVVRAEDIQRLGITRAEELDELIPDLEIDDFAGTFMAVKVRGVQQRYWNPNYEMSTAIHIDGVQLTRTNNFNNMIYDMQRVEVLKGPQGTLYGRGAIGGTINIVSQKPILNKTTGNFSVNTGSDKLRQFEGALNIPLAEKVAMRFSGRFVKRDGPTDSNMGNQHSWGGRTSFTWEATDKDTVIATFDFEGSETSGYGGSGYYFDTFGSLNIVPNPNGTTWVQTLSSTPADGPIRLPFQDRWALPYSADKDMNNNDNNTWGTMLQWEHLFSFGYLTTVYGHRSMHEDKYWSRGNVSLSGAPATFSLFGFNWVDYWAWCDDPNRNTTGIVVYQIKPGITNPRRFQAADYYQIGAMINITDPSYVSHSYNSSHTDTLESRLTSNASIASGSGYEWIVGFMMQHDTLAAYNDSLHLQTGGYGSGEYWAEYTTLTRGYFAQAAWTPPWWVFKDRLIFSAGYRKNLDIKKYYGIQFKAGYILDLNNVPQTDANGNYITDANGDVVTVPGDPRDYIRIRWNVSTYKFNISYFVTDNIMPYIQYALGYKAGSYNFDGSITQPETNDTYEGGIKSQFFNNRLRVNLSGYYYIYKNYQQNSYAYWCEAEDETNPHYCLDIVSVDANGYLLDANGDLVYDVNGDPTTDAGLGTGNYYDANGVVTQFENLPDSYGTQLGITMGESIQKGANAQITWMITGKDTLSANASWSDNVYKGISTADALIAAFPDDPPDNAYTSQYAMYNTRGRFGGTPYRGSISWSHMERLGMDMINFSLRGQYEGRQRGQTINLGQTNQYDLPGRGDYWISNLSVSYMSSRWVPEGVRWNLRLSVNNVTNSQRLRSVTFTSGSNYLDYSGLVTGSYIQKRQTTLSLGFNF